MRPYLHFLTSLTLLGVLLFACQEPESDTTTPGDPAEKPEEPENPDNPGTPDEPDVPAGFQGGEAPEGDYTLADNTVFLSDDFVKSITGLNTTYRRFETSSEALPEVGQILAYNQPSPFFPEGLLCKVVAVEGRFIYYDPVTLEEAFPQLKIDETGIDLAAHVAYILDGNGNPVQFTRTRDVASSSFSIAIPSTTWELYKTGVNYNGLEASLKLLLNPSMRVTLGLRFQVIIQDGEVLVMNALVDPSIHLGASISAIGELAAEQSVPLFTVYFNPIPIGPLVFIPKITLEGYMKVDGSVGVEASISYDKGFSIGAAYETGDWRPILRGVDTQGSGSNPATFSSKVEGGVSFGLRPALEFRLYDILGVAIGTDVSLRAGVSHKLDLNDPAAYNSPLNDISFNTSLNIKGTLQMNAKVAGKVLYEALNLSTPEMNFTLYESWLMPEICTSTMKIEPHATGATVTGMLKRNVFRKGNLYAHAYDPTDYEYVADPDGGWHTEYKNSRYVSVDWTEPKSKEDSTEFQVDLVGFQEGVTYQVDMVMGLPGTDKYVLRGDSTLFFRTYNEKQAQAVAAFVNKVATAMNWVDTPWYEVSPSEVLYMEKEGIRLSTDYQDGHLLFITLSPDPSWRYPDSIHIGADVSSTLDDGQFWQLFCKRDYKEEEIANITSIIVEDPKYGGGIPAGKGLKHYEVHSPYYTGNFSATGLASLQTLDLSGSGVTSVSIGNTLTAGENPFKLTEAKLENCSDLKNVFIRWPYHHDLPILSVAGSTALEQIDFEECRFGDNARITGIQGLKWFNARACSGHVIVPSGVEHANFNLLYPDLSVTASGLPDLKSLGFYLPSAYEVDTPVEFANVTLSGLSLEQEKLKIAATNISITNVQVKTMELEPSKTVEVTACPLLEKLSVSAPDSFTYSGLGNFTGLSGLQTIYIGCYGPAATGLVPPVIDEVRKRGGSVSYPQRYYYKFDRNLGEKGRWTLDYDTGYGFYYSGEPSPRCYHYQKPAGYDEYNN